MGVCELGVSLRVKGKVCGPKNPRVEVNQCGSTPLIGNVHVGHQRLSPTSISGTNLHPWCNLSGCLEEACLLPAKGNKQHGTKD